MHMKVFRGYFIIKAYFKYSSALQARKKSKFVLKKIWKQSLKVLEKFGKNS